MIDFVDKCPHSRRPHLFKHLFSIVHSVLILIYPESTSSECHFNTSMSKLPNYNIGGCAVWAVHVLVTVSIRFLLGPIRGDRRSY